MKKIKFLLFLALTFAISTAPSSVFSSISQDIPTHNLEKTACTNLYANSLESTDNPQTDSKSETESATESKPESETESSEASSMKIVWEYSLDNDALSNILEDINKETDSISDITNPKNHTANLFMLDEKGEPRNGLMKLDGNFYYYKNGKVFNKGLKVIKKNGKKNYYYFTKSGKACLNTVKKVKIKGKGYYFYFGNKGKAATGKFKTVNKKTYYFGKNGRAATGEKMIFHYLCYFGSNGVMYRRIDKNKKMVALTYDDGPSENTKTILSTLKANDAVATFFVVGSRARTYSSIIKDEYASGCEIGNHSYNHVTLTKCDIGHIKSEINNTNSVVKNLTGASPVIMRPPGGSQNSTVRNTVDMPLILWSIDTLDWKTRNASKTISSVLNNVRDGDIVLMHDLYEPTAIASKTIIPKLKEKGYQLVTVSEMAKCRKNLKDGVCYYSLR